MKISSHFPALDRHLLTALGEKGSLWAVLYVVGYLQLDFRWFLMAVVGAYLLHLWWTQRAEERDKEKRRKEAEEVRLASGGRRMLLHPQDLPAWVLHPDTQRANWANMLCAQLWPNLEEFVRATLRSVEEDEDLRARLRGYGLCRVAFPTVSLGSIPPRLTGVKVHKSVHRDEVILDLAVQYSGDLDIALEAEFAAAPAVLPKASASIRNMCFAGNLRVHLRPLLQDVPFVGGVTVSFLQPPSLDFDLGGLANVLDLPGVSHLLRHVIQDQLEQTIVMPNSLTVDLVASGERPRRASASAKGGAKADPDESLRLALPQGVLCVNLIEAKDLVNKDSALLGQGKSDPYAKLRLVADGVAHNFKTPVVPDNLHPVWRLLVDLPVDNPDSLDDLQVELWDKDVASKDDFLGRCSIGAQTVHTAMTTGSAQDVWRPLDGVKKGSFHAEVGWGELKLSRPDQERGAGLHQGVLAVYVDSCLNLLGGRTGLKLPNPCVRVELCGIAQQTDHVVGSVNPVFSHRMTFLVRDPDSDTLKLSVTDEKRGHAPLGALRVNLSDLTERASLAVHNNVYVLQAPRSAGQQGGHHGGGNRSPAVVLSLAFRFLHRPKTSSFGGHKSLQDLHKIMSATVGKKPTGEDLNARKPNGSKPASIANGGGKVNGVKSTIVNNNNNNNVVKPPTEPPKKQAPVISAEESPNPRIPKLIHPGPAFGESIHGLRSIDSSSSQETSAVIIPKPNGIIDTTRPQAQAQTLPRSASASATAYSPLPEIIKVRPEEATEFVRNNAVRRSVDPRMMRPGHATSSSNATSANGPLKASPSVPVGVTDLANVPKIQLSLKYSARTFTLSLVAHRARHLHETPHTTLPSPYVKTYLLESTGQPGKSVRVSNSKRKTKVQRNTVQPVFEETLEYLVRPQEMRARRLELSVCSDRGMLGRNVALGRSLISLDRIHEAVFGGKTVKQEATVTDWHELFPATQFDLMQEAVPRSPSNSSTAPGSAALSRRSKKISSSRSSLA